MEYPITETLVVNMGVKRIGAVNATESIRIPSTKNEPKYVEVIMRAIRMTLAEAFQDFVVFPTD